MSAPDRNHRLLVFDCHEAWVYQLRVLPQAMDVIVGLQGRHTANWDEAMRPIPANARIVRLADIRCGRKNHQTAKSAGLSGRCVTTHPPAPLPVYFKTDFSKH